MDDKLFKGPEIDRLFKIHRNTRRAWKARGILTPTVIGGIEYYRASDVRRVIDDGVETWVVASPEGRRI